MKEICWAKPALWGNEQRYVSEALESTWLSGGPFVDRFEVDFTRYAQMKCAITTANGTAALHLAFLALGIGPDDEVIVPGYGFMAAANVALHVGARPVFVDVDERTWCLTAENIEASLTQHTKAIVPIHTYGNTCPINDILDVSKKFKVPVIEDTAEAFGSRYRGVLAGTFGVLGVYSFQATKTITTGEGGMVVTNDDELAVRLRLFRNHGMGQRRYWHDVVGHNFRLTNLQAAIGCAQLENVEEIVRERRRVWQQYRSRLIEIPGVTLQHFTSEVDPVIWAVAIRLDTQVYRMGRDWIIEEMKKLGIETRPGFYPPTSMKHYGSRPLPVSEEISQQIICLPFFPTLKEEEIEFICSSLLELVN